MCKIVLVTRCTLCSVFHMETITFARRSYNVTQELPVPAMLAADGLLRQVIIVGLRGSTRMLQTWKAGDVIVLRAISATGRTEEQIVG